MACYQEFSGKYEPLHMQTLFPRPLFPSHGLVSRLGLDVMSSKGKEAIAQRLHMPLQKQIGILKMVQLVRLAPMMAQGVLPNTTLYQVGEM